MSPTTNSRNPVISRTWQILAIRALGMLSAAVSHRPGPFSASPATSIAMNWPRPVLAGCSPSASGRTALLMWARHVIKTSGPLPSGCVTIAWDRQAPTCPRSALIDSPATRTTSCLHSPQRLQQHITRGIIDWPIMSSPSLGRSGCHQISLRGRHYE